MVIKYGCPSSKHEYTRLRRDVGPKDILRLSHIHPSTMRNIDPRVCAAAARNVFSSKNVSIGSCGAHVIFHENTCEHGTRFQKNRSQCLQSELAPCSPVLHEGSSVKEQVFSDTEICHALECKSTVHG